MAWAPKLADFQLVENVCKICGYIRFRKPIKTLFSRYTPLGPVAIDVMEEGASTLVASMNDVASDGKSARLALEIPNIGSDYAGRLVSRVRRQSILRQARLTVEAAARMALQEGVSLAKGLA